MGIGTVVAALLMAAIGIIMVVTSKKSPVTLKDGVVGQSKTKSVGYPAIGWIGFVIIVGAILLFVTTFVTIIPAGQRGVVTWFGSVENRVLGEGLAVVMPVAESVTVVDVRVQPHPFSKIDASSKEYQSVSLTGMMNYRLNPDKVNQLYQKVGLDFAAKIIDPAFNDIVKEVLPQYTINEILPKRDEIRSQAKSKLNAILAQYDIEVVDIYIANMEFSADYMKAIEQKQIAEQQVATEKNILAQKEIKAQQAVAEAQGLADAEVVRAKGVAQANKEIASSLTPEVLQSQYINKIADKISVMLVPSGQQFLLDTKSLLQNSTDSQTQSQNKQ